MSSRRKSSTPCMIRVSNTLVEEEEEDGSGGRGGGGGGGGDGDAGGGGGGSTDMEASCPTNTSSSSSRPPSTSMADDSLEGASSQVLPGESSRPSSAPPTEEEQSSPVPDEEKEKEEEEEVVEGKGKGEVEEKEEVEMGMEVEGEGDGDGEEEELEGDQCTQEPQQNQQLGGAEGGAAGGGAGGGGGGAGGSFKCKYCPFSTASMADFKEHVDGTHPNVILNPLYLCAACNFSTKKFDSLTEHNETYHPGQSNFKFKRVQLDGRTVLEQTIEGVLHNPFDLDNEDTEADDAATAVAGGGGGGGGDDDGGSVPDFALSSSGTSANAGKPKVGVATAAEEKEKGKEAESPKQNIFGQQGSNELQRHLEKLISRDQITAVNVNGTVLIPDPSITHGLSVSVSSHVTPLLQRPPNLSCVPKIAVPLNTTKYNPSLDSNALLMTSFSRFPYPTHAELSWLTAASKHPEEQIKVWFTTQRLKQGITWSPEEVEEARKKMFNGSVLPGHGHGHHHHHVHFTTVLPSDLQPARSQGGSGLGQASQMLSVAAASAASRTSFSSASVTVTTVSHVASSSLKRPMSGPPFHMEAKRVAVLPSSSSSSSLSANDPKEKLPMAPPPPPPPPHPSSSSTSKERLLPMAPPPVPPELRRAMPSSSSSSSSSSFSSHFYAPDASMKHRPLGHHHHHQHHHQHHLAPIVSLKGKPPVALPLMSSKDRVPLLPLAMSMSMSMPPPPPLMLPKDRQTAMSPTFAAEMKRSAAIAAAIAGATTATAVPHMKRHAPSSPSSSSSSSSSSSLPAMPKDPKFSLPLSPVYLPSDVNLPMAPPLAVPQLKRPTIIQTARGPGKTLLPLPPTFPLDGRPPPLTTTREQHQQQQQQQQQQQFADSKTAGESRHHHHPDAKQSNGVSSAPVSISQSLEAKSWLNGSLSLHLQSDASVPAKVPMVPTQFPLLERVKGKTAAQLQLLEESFQRNSHPPHAELDGLSAATRMSRDEIGSWFLERRALRDNLEQALLNSMGARSSRFGDALERRQPQQQQQQPQQQHTQQKQTTVLNGAHKLSGGGGGGLALSPLHPIVAPPSSPLPAHLNGKALALLRSVFSQTQWPSPEDYSLLESQTGLPRTDIVRWFKDSRSELRNGTIDWPELSLYYSKSNNNNNSNNNTNNNNGGHNGQGLLLAATVNHGGGSNKLIQRYCQEDKTPMTMTSMTSTGGGGAAPAAILDVESAAAGLRGVDCAKLNSQEIQEWFANALGHGLPELGRNGGGGGGGGHHNGNGRGGGRGDCGSWMQDSMRRAAAIGGGGAGGGAPELVSDTD